MFDRSDIVALDHFGSVELMVLEPAQHVLISAENSKNQIVFVLRMRVLLRLVDVPTQLVATVQSCLTSFTTNSLLSVYSL